MSLVITAIALALVTCPAIYITIKEANKRRKTYIKIGLKPLLGLLWLLIILLGMFTTVEKNSVGIVFDEVNGGLQDKTLGEGVHVITPFQKVTIIQTSNKTQSIVVAGQTSDSIYADFMITIVYRIDTQNAGRFFRRTNAGDVDSVQLNSAAKEILQSVSIKYNIYGVLGEDFEVLRQEFTTKLTSSMLERYHVTIVSTSFDDVDAGSRIEEIIRSKGEALQQIEIEELNKSKAEIQKQILMIEATAQAEVVRIAAQAEADKIEFEKKALANMISEYIKSFPTLTEKEVAGIVLQTVFFEKWNGVLPEVVTGDALEALLGSLLTKE
jgi:regulator of protease activity HflC (stomatin/prohibitin superfamily)